MDEETQHWLQNLEKDIVLMYEYLDTPGALATEWTDPLQGIECEVLG